MGLIKCVDCGTEVSDAAPACVKCGRPVASRNTETSRGTSAMVGAAVGFAAGFVTTWGACDNFNVRAFHNDLPLAAILLAGGLFAVVGAIIGTAMSPRKHS